MQKTPVGFLFSSKTFTQLCQSDIVYRESSFIFYSLIIVKNNIFRTITSVHIFTEYNVTSHTCIFMSDDWSIIFRLIYTRHLKIANSDSYEASSDFLLFPVNTIHAWNFQGALSHRLRMRESATL